MRAKTVAERNRTDEERTYYRTNARVYAWLSRVYDLTVFSLGGLRRRVVRAARLPDRARVLDVATGTGEQAFAFAPRAAQVVGIDLSRDMLRFARKKNRFANVTFLEADATRLPFPDASFDVAGVSFALHEMPSTIRAQTLREMSRVTRPGGTVVVVDYALPRNPFARWLVYHGVRLYERDHYPDFVRSDLPALLRASGLEPCADHQVLGGAARIAVSVVLPDSRSPLDLLSGRI